MEDITDSDYMRAKSVCKEFETKKLGKYHDLYFRNDALLFADVFESFREMCLKDYHLDPAKFFLALGLAWQAAFQSESTLYSFLNVKELLARNRREI